MAFEIPPDLSRKFKGAVPFLSPLEAFGSDVQVPTGFSAPQPVPMAGRWSDAMTTAGSISPLEAALASKIEYEMSPAARQQAIQDQLYYAKALGDQMMEYQKENRKYQMMNDIIANLGSAARSAFARYTDPTEIANRVANIGDAYSRGLQASAPLAQIGSGRPAIQYYKT